MAERNSAGKQFSELTSIYFSEAKRAVADGALQEAEQRWFAPGTGGTSPRHHGWLCACLKTGHGYSASFHSNGRKTLLTPAPGARVTRGAARLGHAPGAGAGALPHQTNHSVCLNPAAGGTVLLTTRLLTASSAPCPTPLRHAAPG